MDLQYPLERVEKSWYEQVEEYERELSSPTSIDVSSLVAHGDDEMADDDSSRRTSHSNDNRQMCSGCDSGTDICDKISDEKHCESNQNDERRSSIDSNRTGASSSGCSSAAQNKTASGNDRKWRKREVFETDEAVLARRQKQIDYGKNTTSYKNYVEKVPRLGRGKYDPQTPNKYFKYSRRAFDGTIKKWRKQLHRFDREKQE